ncbi:MAG: hypothetical protein ACW98Y_05155 [Candidatus Thorarchaeota archaeon]|jgi:hypothetical protein
MKTENRILVLRAGYWIGAILDGIYSINVLLVWLIDGYSGFDPIRLLRFTEGLPSRYAWGMVFAFMISWTILLIWADRKPVERRDVILLTAFPLVSILLADTFFAIAANLVGWGDILAIQLVYIFLIVIFAVGYLLTRRLENDST